MENVSSILQLLRNARVGDTICANDQNLFVSACSRVSGCPCKDCAFNKDRHNSPPIDVPADYREQLRRKFEGCSQLPRQFVGQCPYIFACTSPYRHDGISVIFIRENQNNAKKERLRKLKTTKKNNNP